MWVWHATKFCNYCYGLIRDWEIYNDQTYSFPRHWRVSVSWRANWGHHGEPLKPFEHHRIMTLRSLRWAIYELQKEWNVNIYLTNENIKMIIIIIRIWCEIFSHHWWHTRVFSCADFLPWDTWPSKKCSFFLSLGLVKLGYVWLFRSGFVRLGFFFTMNCPTA